MAVNNDIIITTLVYQFLKEKCEEAADIFSRYVVPILEDLPPAAPKLTDIVQKYLRANPRRHGILDEAVSKFLHACQKQHSTEITAKDENTSPPNSYSVQYEVLVTTEDLESATPVEDPTPEVINSNLAKYIKLEAGDVSVQPVKAQEQGKPKPYHCPRCPKCFAHTAQLSVHIRTVHNKERRFVCQVCNKRFGQLGHLTSHESAVHRNIKPYVCPFCNRAFSKITNMKEHVNAIHLQQKHPCEICQKNFTCATNLNKHRRVVHFSTRPHVCQLCQRAFKQLHHLERHVSVVHEQKKPFRCSNCNLRFSQSRDLFNHNNTVHLKLKTHWCDDCAKGFPNLQRLKKHVLAVHKKLITAENVVPHLVSSCTLCGKSLSDVTSLKEHIENEHLKKKVAHEGLAENQCSSVPSSKVVGNIVMEDNGANNVPTRTGAYSMDSGVCEISNIQYSSIYTDVPVEECKTMDFHVVAEENVFSEGCREEVVAMTVLDNAEIIMETNS